MTRSRRVAVLRADGIKLHRPIRRFSIFRFSAFLPANHQRLRRTRPSVPAPPGRATPSIYISVASTATILKFRRPTSRSLRRYSVAPSTTLLGGAPLKRKPPFSTNSPVPSGSLRAPDQSVPQRYPTATKIPLLLPCLPTFASAVTPRGQRVTAQRPWHHTMVAAHSVTGGGVDHMMAFVQWATNFCPSTQMGGGVFLRKSFLRADDWTLNILGGD